MESDLNKLLASLPKYPSFSLIHFSNNCNLINELKEFTKEAQEYLILTFSKNSLETLVKYENSSIKVQLINPKRPKYHNPSKSYDYLFITSLPEDRESFYKKIYYALKNAAPIFIFLKQSQKELSKKIESELIDNNFVATNILTIDQYIVVSGRKMHGWSGA